MGKRQAHRRGSDAIIRLGAEEAGATRVFLVGESPELAAEVLRQDGLRLAGQVPNLTLLLSLIRDLPADVLLLTREGLDDWPPEQALPRVRALNPSLRLALVLEPDAPNPGADWLLSAKASPRQLLRAILAGAPPVHESVPRGEGNDGRYEDEPLLDGRPPEGLLRLFVRSGNGEIAASTRDATVSPDPGFRPPRPRSPAVIAVCGPKGGVGRTTMAVNLAAALAREAPRSVLLADLSLRAADVGVHLDLLDGPSLSDALPYAAEGKLDRILPYVQEHSATGLRVLLGPPRADLGEVVEPRAVASLLQVLRRHYNYVVIDSSGRCADDPLSACLQVSDHFVIVTTIDPAALRQTRRELEALRRLGVPLEERILVVANRVRPEGPVNRRQAEEFLGLPIGVEVAEDYATASRALLLGEPAVLRAPGSPLAAGVAELLAGLGFTPNVQQAAPGWLARLRRR